MKLGKRSRWIIIFAVLLTSLFIFFSQSDRVQATFGDLHAVTVLLRVEREIMQKTPAGQYYESLFWKHNDEIMSIMQSHPEHSAELWQATRVFIPELEALLNGEGDQVSITAEHVKSLQAELDWFSASGNPALQQDIQREQQRFPLDDFVGMTMSDAFDFINATWSPDSPAKKTLVPNFDGKWAYFVHNGLYFEYPSNYSLQISGSEKDYIYFVPTPGSPEQWDPSVVKVRVWSVPASETNANDPRSWFSHENVVWESPVQNSEFPGIEFISSWSNPSHLDLHAFLYNQEKRIAVEVWVLMMESGPRPNDMDYSIMVHQQYEYFQHMVDTIKLDSSSISEFPTYQTSVSGVTIQPSSTPELLVTPIFVPGSDGSWVSYVHSGVYLEYPSSYYFQQYNGTGDPIVEYIGFHPKEWHDEQRQPYSINVQIWNGSILEKEQLTDALHSSESMTWEKVIQNEEFEGVEYVLSQSNGTVMELGAILYNQDNQLILQIFVTGFSPVPPDSDYFIMINQQYPYFQHIIDNIRIEIP
jgi:hypothetical protein